jgi:hypothetical protein
MSAPQIRISKKTVTIKIRKQILISVIKISPAQAPDAFRARQALMVP